MHLAAAVGALRVRNFRLFWVSQVVSGTGTWMQVVAVSWLVLDISHSSPTALGTITFIQFLPMMLLSLPAGVLVDRVSKRRLLIGTQTAAMAQASTLAALVALHDARLWTVALLALLLGTVNALNNPTQQAFVPDLVPKHLVSDAVALNSAQFNASRMVGSALGGIAVATIGMTSTLIINAATFALPILALFTMRRRELLHSPETAHKRGSVELHEGIRYVFRTPPVLAVIGLLAVIGTLGFNWQVVAPLLARIVLHHGAIGFGLLLSAMAAGSLVGAATLTFARTPSERRLVVAGVSLGLCLIALGISTSYPVSVALMALAGLAGGMFSVSANSRLQLLSPPRLRGRIMSFYVLLMGGSTPIGGFLLGQAAAQLGVGTAVWLFGAVCVLLVFVVAVIRRAAMAPQPIEPSNSPIEPRA
ncbi:MAG: MFS transporter [Solirubrobacteraceae bacterium]